MATVTNSALSGIEADAAKNPYLPEELRNALSSVHLPEVQEMIRKLRKYNMGVVALHGHDDETGHFTAWPEGKMQVESDLKVTFEDTADVQARMEEFVPVGWVWEDNGTTAMSVCNTVCRKRGSDTQHYNFHESQG